MAQSRDVCADYMLSFELLSSVHSECRIPADMMEQCLLLEQEQPSIREVQIQRQCDELMAKNGDLEQRLMLAETANKNLQARHDTLRHNFTSLHRIAVSKLRQRDMEIASLRQNLHLSSKDSSHSVAAVMDRLQSFGPLTLTEITEMNNRISDLCSPIMNQITASEQPCQTLSDQSSLSAHFHDSTNTAVVDDEQVASIDKSMHMDSNVSRALIKPDLCNSAPVGDISISIVTDSTIISPPVLISSLAHTTLNYMKVASNQNMAPLYSTCRVLSSVNDSSVVIVSPSVSEKNCIASRESCRVEGEHCLSNVGQYTVGEKVSENEQISHKDECEKNLKLKSMTANLKLEVTSTTTCSGNVLYANHITSDKDKRLDCSADVEVNGKSLSVPVTSVNKDSSVAGFSKKSDVLRKSKNSPGVSEKNNLLLNPNLALARPDGSHKSAAVASDIHMSVEAKVNIDIPASKQIEPTSSISSSVKCGKKVSNKSLESSVDLVSRVSKKTESGKEKNSTPVLVLSNPVKKSNENRKCKDSSLVVDIQSTESGQMDIVTDEKHDDKPPVKKRKRSSEATDSSLGHIKRLKPSANLKTNPVIIQPPVICPKLTDPERIIRYKAAGDQRECDSRRSFVEMEHLHRKILSTRSSSQVVNCEELQVDKVAEQSSITTVANEDVTRLNSTSKGRGLTGMPSSLSVFTLRSMQKAENEKLEQIEQKKQQLIEKETASFVHHNADIALASFTSPVEKSMPAKALSRPESIGEAKKRVVDTSLTESGNFDPNGVNHTNCNKLKLSGENNRVNSTIIPLNNHKTSMESKLTTVKVEAFDCTQFNFASSVVKVKSEPKEENSFGHVRQTVLRDETSMAVKAENQVQVQVLFSGSTAPSSVESMSNTVVSSIEQVGEADHGKSAKMASSSLQTVACTPVNTSSMCVSDSVKSTRSYSSNIRIVKKSKSSQSAGVVVEKQLSEDETSQKVLLQRETSLSAPLGNPTSQIDVLKRLQDMLSAPKQNESTNEVHGSHRNTSAIATSRRDPRLKAMHMRESATPTESSLSPLDILSALTGSCIASSAGQTIIDPAAPLPISQSEVDESRISASAKSFGYKIRLVDDIKPQVLPQIDSSISCNSIDSNVAKQCLTGFNNDPRIDYMLGSLSKYPAHNNRSPQKNGLSLETCEQDMKSFRVCYWSPNKLAVNHSPEESLKNESLSMCAESAVNEVVQHTDKCNAPESSLSVDLLDFAITGRPDELDVSCVDSMASTVDDADSRGFGIEETNYTYGSTCTIFGSEDQTQCGNIDSNLLPKSVISPLGNLDSAETDMPKAADKPMLINDDHLLAVKNEYDRSCSSYCSDKNCDKTVSSTREFTPSLATDSDCDADQTLTADCRAFKAVNLHDPGDSVASHHSDSSESIQSASVDKSNPHKPALERRQKTSENDSYDNWDIEPSSSDDEDHGRSGKYQTPSDNGRPSSLSEHVGDALENCDGSDGECFSESDEECDALQKESSELQQSVASVSYRWGSEEPTEQTIGQYCEQYEPVLLLTEGDNTMNRLFGEISDSDSECCGEVPERTNYPSVLGKGKGDVEDGEIDDSETERCRAARNVADELKDNKKEKPNVHGDDASSFKRRTSKSDLPDVAKSSGPDHTKSKRNDQSSSSESRRNSVIDDARRKSRWNTNHESRRSDVRRDRNDSVVDDHRQRRLPISPRKQSSRKRSPVIRSPLRTRTAENIRHSTSNSTYRCEPAGRDRNYALSARRRSPARPRISK